MLFSTAALKRQTELSKNKQEFKTKKTKAINNKELRIPC